MAQKKKQSKRQSQSPNQMKYQSIYLFLGILITFLSLVAIFNWGIMGLMLTNGFRLMVGESYGLLLYTSLFLGSMMMLKGRVINVPLRPLLGGFLIIIALAGALHFIEYYDYLQNNTQQSAFEHAFRIYRKELLSQQSISSLGGGLVGAGLYVSIGYLFGKWGSYLFFFVSFFIGLIFLLDRPLITGWQAIQQLFSQMTNLFKELFPDFSELKEVYQDKGDDLNDERSIIAASPLEENPDEVMNIEGNELNESKQEKQNVFTTLFSRFYSFFMKTEETQSLPPKDVSFNNRTAYMPTFEREDQPAFNPTTEYEFKPYRQEDYQQKSLNSKRLSQEEGRVLDLDFFDQMHDQEIAHSQADSQSIDSMTKEQLNPLPTKEVESLEEIETAIAQDEMADEALSKQTPNKADVLATASHWQDASNQRQALTDDDLDQVLSKEELQKQTKTKQKKSKTYQFPGKKLLKKLPVVDQSEEYQRINDNIKKLELTFESFGVDAKIVKANLGPSVTKYEIEPAVGVKVSKIVSLSDDIALALAARDIRMEAPIPGKSLIGIEVPNTQVSPVAFSEIVDAGLESDKLLEVPLGRDISGSVCLADLTKMPHLLIAGATGSGKSVGVNVIICSILMKAKPEDIKFLMIDPKKVELTLYNDLPHQLSPVVTNPRKAARALNNVVEEMERRYELFATSGVRNIDGYNEQVESWNKEEGTGYEKLPKIVVIIDELADLMMVASNDVENAIIRLAQMARAAGIHMIIATQRPSVDVITGIIKANIPSRLAFAVSSGTDSRTILDSVGAEKLLGRGDMLFQPMGKNKPIRVQGAYISDEEVERITDFIKQQRQADYDENIVVSEESVLNSEASDDEYYLEAVELIKEQDTISISQLQRKFRIGYNRAARMIDDLEAQGLVSAQDGSKPRQVLIESNED
ncbi:DNA translocase FtsK [Facklamia sp. P12934]|uniref:DNA translocase FtsK n=1 Tax=Facklamia sp. P12934 TaxID=3421948 RepID=UPI003D168D04